jgi:hypothetical protein
MKTVGQIIDHIDKLIAIAEEHALNPDRAYSLREQALHNRRSMIALREFIIEDGGSGSV